MRLFFSESNQVVKNEDFEYISKQIIQLFPHESTETYFIPPITKKNSKENKPGISRGKLVDRFRNNIKFIKSVIPFNLKNRVDKNINDTGKYIHRSRILIVFKCFFNCNKIYIYRFRNCRTI
ncbi:hypothetical protein PUN28_018445 [Cardiocondyla obscurior]|uniref:Uncharacterized protein n=1 Tax=Cardiocondyla obscurior TaxID=286306 RepID=A0AAW2EDW6_9HYME